MQQLGIVSSSDPRFRRIHIFFQDSIFVDCVCTPEYFLPGVFESCTYCKQSVVTIYQRNKDPASTKRETISTGHSSFRSLFILIFTECGRRCHALWRAGFILCQRFYSLTELTLLTNSTPIVFGSFGDAVVSPENAEIEEEIQNVLDSCEPIIC